MTQIVRITQRGRRAYAACSCGWTTVSTGGRAVERVVKLAMRHRCRL